VAAAPDPVLVADWPGSAEVAAALFPVLVAD
jgi:hypothetical protein